MSVSSTALTSLNEALSYIGDRQERDGFWIYASQGDATAATVEVTDTAIVLTITGGEEAGATTLTFADSDKNTLSELVNAVNAVTGWAAGRIYHASADSTDLIVTGSLSCLGSANEVTLKIKDNYLIERLIDRATDAIERLCNRKLLSRTYTREVYDGNGQNRLILRQYPVTRVTRLSVGRKNAFHATCSATTYAFIEINSTQVLLNKDGTTTTLTIADYATLALLIAAIDETSGWTATIASSDYSSYAASEILTTPALACKSPDLAYIQMVDEDVSDFHVENIGDEFTNAGIIYYPAGFPSGPNSVFVTYISGHTSIPYALEQVCLELVKLKYDESRRSAGLQSEHLGDYVYTVKDIKDLPENMKATIDLFKRRVL